MVRASVLGMPLAPKDVLQTRGKSSDVQRWPWNRIQWSKLIWVEESKNKALPLSVGLCPEARN